MTSVENWKPTIEETVQIGLFNLIPFNQNKFYYVLQAKGCNNINLNSWF
jgi:hypothetical protein